MHRYITMINTILYKFTKRTIFITIENCFIIAQLLLVACAHTHKSHKAKPKINSQSIDSLI